MATTGAGNAMKLEDANDLLDDPEENLDRTPTDSNKVGEGGGNPIELDFKGLYQRFSNE